MPNNPPKVDFKARQQAFSAYIRDPDHHPIPNGIKKNRMQMYRELFFNNVEGFLAGNFPVMRQLLDDPQWLALVQDFFAHHHCSSPYFAEIPEEFLDYLQNERQNSHDLPFLVELAHYEWAEMAVSIAKEIYPTGSDGLVINLESTLQLSPLAWPLAYGYPVHKISPHFMPLTAPEQPTCLVVYRDIEDEVHFLEITPITYRLLEIIQENGGATVQSCLIQVAEETRQVNIGQTVSAGLEILQGLADKVIVTAIT